MKSLFFAFILINLTVHTTAFGDNTVRDKTIPGLYKAILLHESKNFYQHANITLRTVNPGTQMKISANIRIFFGEDESNEFLTYEFDDCPMNPITRQISIKNEKNEVSFIGFLRPTGLEGEWFATSVGKVGKFSAKKGMIPSIPPDAILVKSLTGHYRGKIENTHPESGLPEDATLSLVTNQDSGVGEAALKISGSLRLYFGEFGSTDYYETKLAEPSFKFYNRYLIARTVDYGLTLKGFMSQDGIFKGVVFAEGIGEAANVEFKRQ